jgi:hypothetical protein
MAAACEVQREEEEKQSNQEIPAQVIFVIEGIVYSIVCDDGV